MLILFDIDGTMLSSEGVGVRSFEDTAQSLFGMPCSLEGIPVGGRLDPLIWKDVCSKYEIEYSDALHDEFRQLYIQRLAKNIQEIEVKVLPGVRELVKSCHEMHDVTLGIVTGNYEPAAMIKLKAAGFDPTMFVANAWGTDGKVRSDLPPVALRMHGKTEPTVLIGDTVHDITSGQEAGCRVIAVCTGSHDHATLVQANPELLLEDLGDTEAILHWMFNTQTQSP